MYTVRGIPRIQVRQYAPGAFGGANGELAAACSIIRFKLHDPERKRHADDIGTEELSHLEIVGTLARMHLAPMKKIRKNADADPMVAIRRRRRSEL